MSGYELKKKGDNKQEIALTKVSKNEVIQYPPESIKPLTAQDVVDQVKLIKEIQNKVMERDVHYGLIPGCGKKPTLLKAGAEKLCLTFRLAPEVIEQTDLSTPDMIRYRVKINLLRIADGQFVGSGVGECSSAEEKYNWKKTYSKDEFDATAPDKRKLKYNDYNGRKTTIMMIRTNPFDIANTILKMAKKRALVDAVLTSTGASDLFTQDIEEMREVEDNEPQTNGRADLQKDLVQKFATPTAGVLYIDETTVKKIEQSLALINQSEVEVCIDLKLESLTKIPVDRLDEVRNWVKAHTPKKGDK